jgi:hypothetical protein
MNQTAKNHHVAGHQWPTSISGYLGGRAGEDREPAQANSLRDAISKEPITKKGWWSESK